VPLRPLRPGKTGVPTLTLSTPSSQLRRWVHYIETIAAFLVAVGTNTLITVAAAVTTVRLNGFTISCVFFPISHLRLSLSSPDLLIWRQLCPLYFAHVTIQFNSFTGIKLFQYHAHSPR